MASLLEQLEQEKKKAIAGSANCVSAAGRARNDAFSRAQELLRERVMRAINDLENYVVIERHTIGERCPICPELSPHTGERVRCVQPSALLREINKLREVLLGK